MTRRKIVVVAVVVLLLGWTAGLLGWWLTADSRGSGATPSAAVRLDPAERARYSDGAGPAPSTVGILMNDERACTATVVSSTSGSVLATAAHCVYDEGRWFEGLRFHPDYSNGDSRFGIWDVEGAWPPQTWQQTAGRPRAQFRSEHDIAFVRLAPDAAGNRAQDVLGAQGFSFDNPAGSVVTITGYPGEPPYDGQTQQSCAGTARDIGGRDGELVRVDCGLTAGLSGSAWMTDIDPATGLGYLTAVESGGGDGYVVGPPLSAESEQLHQAADRGTS